MPTECNPEDVLRRRKEIDRLDAELVRLLNQRASIALELAELKRGLGWSLCDRERERRVLSQVADSNCGPFDRHGLGRIFRRIICESRRIERRGHASGVPQ